MSSTFFTGNTGRSTGPHLDMRVFNPATGQYEDPSGYTSYLTQGDKPFDFQVTSGYGMRDHPVTGGRKMHHGIDYATPTGTALTIDGSHMSTWNDAGGGVMSQYLINTDDGHRELLLLHGSDQNKITGKGAVIDYKPGDFSSMTPPETPQAPTDSQVQARSRAQEYSKMNKAEMNSAYDSLRQSDPAKAAIEGKKMHRAFFNK
jgi:hypothetical protein